MKKFNLANGIFPTLLMVAATSSAALAAPAVTGTSGSLSTGSTAIVSGSGFGTHTMQFESLQNYIEAGTTGQKFTKTGWTQSDWTWASPTYATDASHSGDKSLKCSVISPGDYNCAFARVLPNPVYAAQRFYVSYWVKYNGSKEAGGQWKMLKFKQQETIVDGPMEWGMGTWFDFQRLAGGVGSTYSEDLEYILWPKAETFPQNDNSWSRMEIEFSSSSVGQKNGTFTIRRTTDTGSIYKESLSNFNSHLNANDHFKYVIWQNYIGNGFTNATIHMDDLYVQTGTLARVELCAGNTWTNRGKCEIQVPTSWSTSSIPITVNTGNFTSGSSAYLYVVDSSGTANTSGYQVSVGVTSSGGTAPTPPSVTATAPQLNSITAQ